MKTRSLPKLIRAVSVSTLCLIAPLAKAIPLDFDVNGLAYYAPASKANNNTDATAAVASVVGWYNGGTNPNGGNITFTLDIGSGIPSPNLPGVTFGFKDDNAPFDEFDPAVYSYALGKYGNVAYIFYLGNLGAGSYSLPSTLGGNGLSHELGFLAVPQTRVPDGGATIVLLGMALVGIASLQRKRRRARAAVNFVHSLAGRG